jgi:hypothetical protein
MTNIDGGKKVYTSYSEAEKVAAKMARTHNEGFNVYKVGNQWAVGGVHTKSERKKQKFNSFDALRVLLNSFKESEEDSSVDDYIAEIESESLVKESSTKGETDDWTLNDVSLRLGRDIGMAPTNIKTYLVLSLGNGAQKLILKMGGNFAPHIPLIQRQAESLVNSAVVWHTWNSSSSNWGTDEWFYRIEKKKA